MLDAKAGKPGRAFAANNRLCACCSAVSKGVSARLVRKAEYSHEQILICNSKITIIEVRQTAIFRAAVRIAQRIVRLQAGLMGGVKAVGGGVSDLRVDHGPGYRVYFLKRGQLVVILLCGGDKKTQKRDVERAKTLALEVE
jgi:putative addiction module killer protein